MKLQVINMDGKKRDNIEENVQSFFELAQKSFSELVIYYDLGDSYAKTRMENHDLLKMCLVLLLNLCHYPHYHIYMYNIVVPNNYYSVFC